MHDEIVVRIKPAILLCYHLAKRWWYLNISLRMLKSDDFYIWFQQIPRVNIFDSQTPHIIHGKFSPLGKLKLILIEKLTLPDGAFFVPSLSLIKSHITCLKYGNGDFPQELFLRLVCLI